MDCRTRITPLCVMINIYHIRFIKNKWDWITFLLKLFQKFDTILLHMSLLLAEETLRFLLDFNLERYLAVPFLFGLILVLSLCCHKCTLSQFYYQSPFLLDKYGEKFINWPLLLMFVVRDFEGSILLWKSVQYIVQLGKIQHLNFKSFQLSHNFPYLNDVLTHTSHTGES